MNIGYTVNVYNRTKDKAELLLDDGAHWYENLKLVAKYNDVVYTILGVSEDVKKVILDPQGLMSGAKEGTILVNMTTSKPSLAQTIFEKGNKREVKTLDVLELVGDLGARKAELPIMVGGEKKVFDRVVSYLSSSERAFHIGESGRRQHTTIFIDEIKYVQHPENLFKQFCNLLNSGIYVFIF